MITLDPPPCLRTRQYRFSHSPGLSDCLQNPTGVDPTEAQWRELSDVMKEKKHFPFFDMVNSFDPDVIAGKLIIV